MARPGRNQPAGWRADHRNRAACASP